MHRRFWMSVTTAVALATALAASATLLPGGKSLRISPENAAANRPFKLKMSSLGTYPVPAAGGTSDPTLYGGQVDVVDLGNPAAALHIDFPNYWWNENGVGAQRKYVFRGQIGYHPCKTVVFGPKRWKLRCSGFTGAGVVSGTMNTPYVGAARVKLTVGQPGSEVVLCQDFGGVERRNDSTLLFRKGAPPNTSCSPSGAFID